jgi:hypothetical protein
MRQLERGIPRLVDVYEGLYTIQTQYDSYCQRSYHKPPEDDDSDELDELQPTEEERAEKQQ